MTGRIIGAPIKVSKIIFLLFVQISSPAVAYDDTLSINERENVNTISTNTALIKYVRRYCKNQKTI